VQWRPTGVRCCGRPSRRARSSGSAEPRTRRLEQCREPFKPVLPIHLVLRSTLHQPVKTARGTTSTGAPSPGDIPRCGCPAAGVWDRQVCHHAKPGRRRKEETAHCGLSSCCSQDSLVPTFGGRCVPLDLQRPDRSPVPGVHKAFGAARTHERLESHERGLAIVTGPNGPAVGRSARSLSLAF
jgi:hypothetical protein